MHGRAKMLELYEKSNLVRLFIYKYKQHFINLFSSGYVRRTIALWNYTAVFRLSHTQPLGLYFNLVCCGHEWSLNSPVCQRWILSIVMDALFDGTNYNKVPLLRGKLKSMETSYLMPQRLLKLFKFSDYRRPRPRKYS